MLNIDWFVEGVKGEAPSEPPESAGEKEAPAGAPKAMEELIFGLVLVGPHNDHGWSEAHYTAGQYVEKTVPGTKMIWLESLNPADRPDTTLEQVVDDMVGQGAKLIFTTSDAFEEDTVPVAKKYPDVVFINISGDDVLTGEAPPNEGNIMGNMVPMKGVAGCAAALATETGTIGYLGPLINFETRRLASAAYLGARHCYEKYRGKNPDDLRFIVTWIGFWFNIPGVTLDPTEVARDFFDTGADVVISGIDTTEALVVAGQRAAQGERVFAIPYDYEGACAEAPDVCLGIPYFNWGPAYAKTAREVMNGTWKQSWDWNPPDWNDINNRDTTGTGFIFGPALTDEQKANLQEFIDGLASGEIVLYKGPLNLQDGTPYLKDGEVATDEQIWYLPQLLEGMEGPSE
ncbi:MAG: BMP family ABC transporter substrate-binding protein [Chloroflexi bacterium]|nr:MAG: BMP family ABC transporter substrate-binding protein [Chloroflexota bacterium]